MSAPGLKMIVAGPCSAESEKLCLDVAAGLARTGYVDLFRGGVWKPRTLRGMYEGPGNDGLKYLLAVRDQYKLPVVTEAATTAHVEAVLKAGLDAIWVGARTVTDPFSVQELANALQGSNIRILVKNPLVPDVRLWAGAVDRLLNKGLNVEALIHRGFVTYNESKFRNEPLWVLMAEMRTRFPDIKIIADPSHMAGNSFYVAGLAAQAKEMEADGLMIEVHSDPPSALSDANQQITPAEFVFLIDSLCGKQSTSLHDASLEALRREIDETDERLLRILAQRIDIVKRMGIVKRDAGMTIMQGGRWKSLVEDRLNRAAALDLNDEFIRELLQVIHDESLRIQMAIINKDQNE